MKPENNDPIVADPVTAWMHHLAVDPSLRPLEDPDLLWMKAQYYDRDAAAQRALRPVVWFDTIARGLVGFTACWLALNGAKAIVVPAFGIANPTLHALMISLLIAAAAVAAYPIVAGE